MSPKNGFGGASRYKQYVPFAAAEAFSRINKKKNQIKLLLSVVFDLNKVLHNTSL